MAREKEIVLIERRQAPIQETITIATTATQTNGARQEPTRRFKTFSSQVKQTRAKSANKETAHLKRTCQINEGNSLESINSKFSSSSATDLEAAAAADEEHKMPALALRQTSENEIVGAAGKDFSGASEEPPKHWQQPALKLGGGEKTKSVHQSEDYYKKEADESCEMQQQQQRQPSVAINKPPFMFAGITAAVGGSILFSLSLLCLKLLPEHEGFTGKMKALFFRGFFMSSLCAITILCQRSTFLIKRDELFVNLLRVVFGTMAVFGSYTALIYIGMGDATALIFSSPIWTSILGHFILKEPIYCSHLLALPVSLLGIILIAHPALIINVDNLSSLTSDTTLRVGSNNSGPGVLVPHVPLGDQLIGADVALSATDSSLLHTDSFEQRWPGILIALLTSLLVSVTYIVLKFRKSTPVQTTTFWFGVGMMAFSVAVLIFTGFGEFPTSMYEWALLLGNGVFSWLGQSLFQWAFLHEQAGVLSIIRTLDVATTFSLSAIFLTEDIFWTSIVGATIIGLVVVSIILNNWIQQTTCMNKKPPPPPVETIRISKDSLYIISKS